MKATKISVLVSIVLIVAACKTTKKTSTSATSTTSPTTATTAPVTSTNNFVLKKPADGIYAPGDEELSAIQIQYKDVTLDKLKEGHMIYTKGACVNCHGAINIYQYGETQWKGIIDDMAQRANISDVQKDAVYKYVLAIKATQPK